jgi:signal transduction histidine kinase
MAGVVLAAVALAVALTSASLSGEELALLIIAAPLIAYLAVRDIELPVRRRPNQTFSTLNWDARAVVLAPLAILTPYGTAALTAGLVSAVVIRRRPPHHSVIVDAYNGATQCLAVLAMGATAETVLGLSRTTLGYTAAVAAGVLTNEIVTFVLIVGLWLVAERYSSPQASPRSDTAVPSALQLVYMSAIFVPVVISVASAVVVSYVNGAHLAAAVLVLLPVLFIELLRLLGRTSVALQKRDQDRDGVLRLIVESAEEQRRLLAEQLHDGPLQSVLACRLLVDDEPTKGDSHPPDARVIERLNPWLDRAATELRAVVRGLVPEVLSQHGLEAALRHDAEMLGGAFPGGLELSLSLDRAPSPHAELLLYRLAHEGLVNAVRHAHADQVTVTVGEENDGLVVRVRDDGRGVSAEEVATAWERGHLGIATLRERVALAGGAFELAHAEGGGTELVASIPVVAASEATESAAAKVATWWAGLPLDAIDEAVPTWHPVPQAQERSPSEPPMPGPLPRAFRRRG